MKKALIAVALLSSSTANISHAVTITFDAPPPSAGSVGISSYAESGYLFSTPNTMVHYGSAQAFSPSNGTAYLQFPVGSQPLSITEQGGALFSLQALDIAAYSTVFSASSVPFIGHRADGSTVFQTIPLTTGINFATVSFNSDFTNLLSVEVNTVGFSMDNVQLSDVQQASIPLSSSLILLLSGIFLFNGIFQRKASKC